MGRVLNPCETLTIYEKITPRFFSLMSYKDGAILTAFTKEAQRSV